MKSERHLNVEELSRLYELLDEYGRTLDEPTNRPLNTLIFEAFHLWEVKKLSKIEEVHWPEGVYFELSESRWVWLESGCWVDSIDDDGQACEDFLTYEFDGFDGKRSLQPTLHIIPDYANSVDEALNLKNRVFLGKVGITESTGGFFPLWRATSVARNGVTYREKAITPSVALLKTVLRQLCDSSCELSSSKHGPPVALQPSDAKIWQNALLSMPGFNLENDIQ